MHAIDDLSDLLRSLLASMHTGRYSSGRVCIREVYFLAREVVPCSSYAYSTSRSSRTPSEMLCISYSNGC